MRREALQAQRIWQRQVFAVATVLALGGGLWVLFQERHTSPPAGLPSLAAAASPRLQRETFRRIADAFAVVPHLHWDASRQDDTEEVDAAARAMVPVFAHLYAQREFYNKAAIYDEVFDYLGSDPTYVEAARRTLFDPDFVRRTSTDQQAVSRVFALRFLKRQAERGDPKPLISATRDLFARMTDEGERLKGQNHDLEGMLTAVLQNNYDVADLLERGPQILSEVLLAEGERYPNIRRPEVAEAVEAAVLRTLWGRATEEQLRGVAMCLRAYLHG